MLLKDFLNSRLFTISNCLSLLRIFLSPFLWIFTEIYTKNPEYLWLIITTTCIIVLTDFFDGFIARKFGQVTPLGQYLDPLADKIAVISALFLIYVYRDFPLWAVLIITTREILGLYGGGFLLIKRNVLGHPNYWGKVGVCLISISWLMYFFEYKYRTWSLWITCGVLAGGIIVYIKTYWYTILKKNN